MKSECESEVITNEQRVTKNLIVSGERRVLAHFGGHNRTFFCSLNSMDRTGNHDESKKTNTTQQKWLRRRHISCFLWDVFYWSQISLRSPISSAIHTEIDYVNATFLISYGTFLLEVKSLCGRPFHRSFIQRLITSIKNFFSSRKGPSRNLQKVILKNRRFTSDVLNHSVHRVVVQLFDTVQPVQQRSAGSLFHVRIVALQNQGPRRLMD